MEGADEQAAVALAEELGDLPLALAQAAAFAHHHGLWLWRLPARIPHAQPQLDAEQEAKPGYGRTVAVTLRMALDRLHEQDDEAAEEVLRRCAFFAPDNIPARFADGQND